MRSERWSSAFASAAKTAGLQAETREELARLDERLYRIWNLGDNVLLGWTYIADQILVLSVRHYAIAESVHSAGPDADGKRHAPSVIDEVLSGPKYRVPEDFERIFRADQQAGLFDRPIESIEPLWIRCAPRRG